jgi:protein phosphatase 1 regulatory subunit 42
MKEMVVLLKCWPKLWKLELAGNPLCLKNKYRERIIVLTPHLEMLDGKEIQEMSRQFLQNWKTSKEIIQRGKIEGVSSANDLSNGLNSSKPGNYNFFLFYSYLLFLLCILNLFFIKTKK